MLPLCKTDQYQLSQQAKITIHRLVPKLSPNVLQCTHISINNLYIAFPKELSILQKKIVKNALQFELMTPAPLITFVQRKCSAVLTIYTEQSCEVIMFYMRKQMW